MEGRGGTYIERRSRSIRRRGGGWVFYKYVGVFWGRFCVFLLVSVCMCVPFFVVYVQVRQRFKSIWILSPGVGAQGGALTEAVKAGEEDQRERGGGKWKV